MLYPWQLLSGDLRMWKAKLTAGEISLGSRCRMEVRFGQIGLLRSHTEHQVHIVFNRSNQDGNLQGKDVAILHSSNHLLDSHWRQCQTFFTDADRTSRPSQNLGIGRREQRVAQHRLCDHT